MPDQKVFVAGNPYHVHRTLYLWKDLGPRRQGPELVRLDVRNSTGGNAFSLALTPDEARALSSALHAAAEGPPDA